MDRTNMMVDKETRAIFKEIAAKKRKPVWVLLQELASQELAKLSEKPRKAVTK